MKRIVFLLFTLSFLFFTETRAQPQRRPRFDAQHPDVHDPVVARGEDGRWHLFSTGWGIGHLSSADLRVWQQEGPVFQAPPQWAVDSVRGYRGHTWAPDISRHHGLWHLYYSCSAFGKNGSAIGLAVNKTLDKSSPEYRWEDRGQVIASHRHRDNWNAIDPNLAIDGKGRPWLLFGSFWDGIQLVQLSKKDFQTTVDKPVTIARRVGRRLTLEEIDDATKFTVEGNDTVEAGENAIEAPFLYFRNGWYYLFVSMDYCCRGERSTYNTVYGRARKITGPYLDRNGNPMAKGGGTYLFGPSEDFFGVGHCAVFEADEQTMFLSHAYEKAYDGRAKLFLCPLQFDADGWIVVPE